MAKIVSMPKLGLTMTEGNITAWLKNEGDPVTAGEALFEVETDKLTNTIEAAQSGVLLKILVPAGETAPCQDPIAVIGQPGEDISVLLPAGKSGEVSAPQATEKKAPAATGVRAGSRVVASPRAKKLAKELGIDITLVSGTGPNGRITEKDVRAYVPQTDEKTVKSSPLAEKLAADLGINLGDVPADGRVLVADVLNFLKKQEAGAPAAHERETVTPMNGMRKAIARNMLNSHMTSPTVSFNLGVDMSAMKNYREELKANGIKLSYTDLLIKVVAKALTEFPLLNCSVEDNKIIYKHYVNMGVAVALDNGLVVPNIVDADKKNLTQISTEVKELAELARAGKLPMEKLSGGTFTITNLGMYGIESFTPIINQPEVAILGVCAIENMPVVRDGQVTIRPIMNLCLTADHRVVDGSVAAQFMQRIEL